MKREESAVLHIVACYAYTIVTALPFIYYWI